MSWLYLFLSLFAFSSLSFFMKLGCQKGNLSLGLVGSLYIVSSFLTLIFLLFSQGSLFFSKSIIVWGVFGGIGGAIAFLLFVNALKIGHYGFSVSIVPASFLIPVIFSIIFWKEALEISRGIGIIFVLFGIFLITSLGSSLGEEQKRLWAKWVTFIGGAFFFNGIPQISQSVVARLQGSNYLSFLFINYISGAILLLIFLTLRRQSFGRTVIWGIGGAVGSILGCYFTLRSLETLSETIVFPISIGGPVTVGVILSRFLFGERINKRGYLGIISGIIGIVILCFK